MERPNFSTAAKNGAGVPSGSRSRHRQGTLHLTGGGNNFPEDVAQTLLAERPVIKTAQMVQDLLLPLRIPGLPNPAYFDLPNGLRQFQTLIDESQ